MRSPVFLFFKSKTWLSHLDDTLKISCSQNCLVHLLQFKITSEHPLSTVSGNGSPAKFRV